MVEAYTLSEAVDEYLALRQISKKKYYPSYLIAAKNAWQHLFRNSAYTINSQWREVKKGSPYNYVEMPSDCSMFLSASFVNESGKIVSLNYDNKLNVIPKPNKTGCGCNKCECGDVCSYMNNLTFTTRVVFVLNGKQYVEKKWVKLCPNGDVLEYRVTPTKKYNDNIGENEGDYNEDYNGDYDKGNSFNFSNFEIVDIELQKVICKLKLKDCGCPDECIENEEILLNTCSEYISFKNPKDICCNTDKSYGSVKFGDCGTKLYYISLNNDSKPDFLLINYKTKSSSCGEFVRVPENAIFALFKGVDYFSKMFNNSYSRAEKEDAKFEFRAAHNELILNNNLLSLEWLENLSNRSVGVTKGDGTHVTKIEFNNIVERKEPQEKQAVAPPPVIDNNYWELE